jgi:vacuolar-type H+-ATPase subunit I/STV1
MVKLTRFANPLTMMKPHCCRTLSSSLGVRMVMQGQQSFSVMNIGFVAGVIPRERIAAFERILWRTLRGNLYMNQSEIPEPIIDPTDNHELHKNVFVIFAHGKEVIAKIRKISESLGADLYSVDENSDLRRTRSMRSIPVSAILLASCATQKIL